MSSEKYVNQAVREVETELEKINQILPAKAVTQLMTLRGRYSYMPLVGQ
jgi:hypothetical protein